MNYYVYILRSKSKLGRFYIGYTANLEKRLQNHAEPKSSAYTRQYAPWELATSVVFNDEILAQQFELYLKSHSGKEFLTKRLIKKVKV